MKKLMQSTVLFFLINLVASTVFAAYMEGDIIGESEITEDPTTSFFEAATGTRYGHVGIIMKEKSGWVVYEEYPPQAQVVSLKEFVSRSHGVYTVIRAHQPLSAETIAKVRVSAKDIVKKAVPYNYSQTSNAGSLNCSEFVRSVFATAQINVGQVQTVGDMNLKTFQGYLWKIWKESAPGTDLKDPVVTPASVMRTAQWDKVEGIDPKATLSDAQLVAQWKKESALKGVAETWGITPERVEKLAQP